MATNEMDLFVSQSESSGNGSRNKCGSYALEKGKSCVPNELLCYLVNKIDILRHDLLVKLVTDFYTDEEVELAKNILFDTVVTESRKRLRKGPNKRNSNVADMIAVIHELHADQLPNYCALDLSRIPPMDLNSVDVTGMVQDIRNIKHSIATCSNNYENPVTANLQTEMNAMKEQMAELLKHVRGSQPSFSQVVQQPKLNLPSVPRMKPTAPPLHNLPADTSVTSVWQSPVPMSAPKPVRKSIPTLKLQPAAASEPSSEDDRFMLDRHGRRRQYRKSKAILGTSASPNSRLSSSETHKRLVSLFVTRLDPDTDVDRVKDYVKSKFKVDFKCVKLDTKYDTYSSFNIEGFCENPADFYKCENWPENILVRKFYKPKETRNARSEPEK